MLLTPPILSRAFPYSSLSLEVGPPKIQLEGLEECCELPQRGLERNRSRNRIWCILVLKMRSGGNNFNYCPENKLTK